ncbi:MAG: sugar ABC transporter permease [Desulfobacterales bacterium]|nr:sugar ABC transporter permease [Desulfobacterales bacterium]
MADLNQSRSKGFFDYLEDAIPKLVLAPTFLAALIFIYGFILWTAWISMTQSALLPNYKIAAGYKITNTALNKMRNEGVSENILKKLRILEKLALTKNKSKFLRDVKKQIGAEQMRIYKNLILKHSYSHDPLFQYKKLFKSDRWMVALKNLLIFASLFIATCIALGLILAIFLDQRIRSEGALRTIYLYPMALSFIVTGAAWKWILNPDLGLERLVRNLGFVEFTFDWLVNSKMAIYTVVIAAVWQSTGFVMALFLAGLRGIDDAIIKAAQVDGASLPRIYLRIIIPSLRPAFLSATIILSHIAIKSFDLVMVLTRGGPGYSSDLPATFMYAFAFNRGRLGFGASSAMMMFFAVMAIIIPYLYSELRKTRYA